MRTRIAFLLAVLLSLSTFSFAQNNGITSTPKLVENPAIYDHRLTPRFDAPVAPSSISPQRSAEEPIGAGYMNRIDKFIWSVDPTVGEVTPAQPRTLSEIGSQAVAVAPNWLKAPLAHRLFEITATDSNALADLIVNPLDERYRDEIAFMVAYAAKSDLEGMKDPVALLIANVQLIYDYDADLDYVEVVDFGETATGEYGTTLHYNILVDGVPTDYELPSEIYYWHVVHPKLDVEGIDYIDPLTGDDVAPNEGGYFYREYLLYDIEGEGNYHTPMYMNGVDEADLQDLGPSARGYLTDESIHNLEIAYQTGTQNVVFSEFAYGSGQVFATTMRLEEAYTANGCPLLEKLLNQGNGDFLLPEDAPIALISDVEVSEIVTALTNLGRWDDVTVYDGDDLAAFTEDDWITFNTTFKKVVVPSGQTLALYQAVANAKAQLETFINGYRVFEIHLATGDADDPAGLIFPGGFTVTEQAANETDAVTLYGRPILADMLAGVDVLWDGEPVGMSGDGPLWDNPNAIQAVGNWVGKNMLDNIQERYDNGDSPERALEPVRIAYNHYGNCGELQDLGAAALRTALIPAGLISTMNEDHVWDEFYFNGEWMPFQVDWSNGAVTLGNPGIAYDKQTGGSKDISFVDFWLGDGRMETAPERYSDYITVNFALTDANGAPAPEAVITLYSEGWMTSMKQEGFWLVTDTNGQATVRLGENRNYFLSIESGAGAYPAKKDGAKVGMELIVAAADAVAGASFDFAHQFDAPLVKVEPMDIEQKNTTFALHVTLNATHRFASAANIFSGQRAYYPLTPPAVDVFLVNDENLDAAKSNEPFQAAQSWLGATSLDELVYPPDVGTWHVMVTHHSSPTAEHLLDLQVTAEGDPFVPPPGDDDNDDNDTNDGGNQDHGDDDDNDEGGCGC